MMKHVQNYQRLKVLSVLFPITSLTHRQLSRVLFYARSSALDSHWMMVSVVAPHTSAAVMAFPEMPRLKHAETGFVGARPVTSPRVSTDSVPAPSQTPPELPGQVSSTGWRVAKIFGVSWMKAGLCIWVSNVWTNDVSLAERCLPNVPKHFPLER